MASVNQQISALPIQAVKPSGETFTGAQAIDTLLRMKRNQEVYPQTTAELITALNAESLINLGQGKTFTFTQGYAFLDKTVRLRGQATFVVDYSVNPGGFTPLEFEYSFSASQSVSALADVAYDFGGGNTDVTRLTVTDASQYAPGDVVKLISQDQIPWLDPADGQKMGSSHVVGAVDTGNQYVYLLDQVYFAYATTVKVARYNQSKSLDMQANIQWRSTATHTGNTRRATLHVKGAYAPIIKHMKSIGTVGEFIGLTGCYHAQTEGNGATNLVTDAASDQYGYVVVERSCGYGEHLKNTGTNVRHVYTNGAVFHPGADDFAEYGCCEYSQVTGSRGFQCSNAVDDTHPGSYCCTLKDTQVYYPNRGVDGTLWSVQVRGVKDTIVSPEIHGGDGVVVRKEYAHDTLASGITILNPLYHAKTGEDIVAPFRVEGLPGSRVLGLKIKGGTVNDCQPVSVLSATHAEVLFEDNDCHCALNGAGSVGPFDLTDASVEVVGGRIDLTGSTASNIRHSLLADSTSTLVCKGGHEVITGGADWAVITDFKGAGGSAYYYELDCDVKPEFPNPSANRGSGAVFRWGYRVAQGRQQGSSLLSLTKSADFSLNGNRLEELTHAQLMVEINLSGASGTTQLTAIPTGAVIGQQLTIANHPSSVHTLQINGGGNVGRASAVAVLPGEAHTYTWSVSGKWMG